MASPRVMFMAACLLYASGVGTAAHEIAQEHCMLQVKHQKRAQLWSAIKAPAQCGQDCVVPAGQTWILDAPMSVQTLTINGVLQWDTTKDGLVLRASYVLVQPGGFFNIGTDAAPMNLGAQIYITKSSASHPSLGVRFLGSMGTGTIQIYGRRLARTWTVLSRTAEVGAQQLLTRDDPTAIGWRVGDRIGIATTHRDTSELRRIVKIAPATEWRLTAATATAGVEDAANGFVAANAIDGNTGTRWGSYCASSCTGTDQWVAVTMQKPSFVTRVRVDFDTAYYAPKFWIQVQKTLGGSWQNVAAVDNSQGGWIELSVQTDAAAVRMYADFLSMASRAQPKWAGLWIYEIQLYGREIGAPIPQALWIDTPLGYEHWGGRRVIQGQSFDMVAEVVNLERSVVITGDHDDFDTTFQGLHTIKAGTGGSMQIKHARVEYCGQRDLMGRYCLHFHLAGSCPSCVFQGNAVVNGHQVGITVHGTHRSLVDNNVLWDTRGVGIYTEDGNEMNNTISNNVVLCSWWEQCSVVWQGRRNSNAGLFFYGMTNNIIGNRIAGWENGIWTPGASFGTGQGKAFGKVCPQFSPFGVFRDNVCHDNIRFGLYLDNQYPRNIVRDSNGYVTDMSTCGQWTSSGADNGVVPASVVRGQFDWHNMFVGQYAMGDISIVGFVGANNYHNMYWKTSKNFADGVSYHLKDALMVNDPRDSIGLLKVYGPSGPFTFRVRNMTFLGGPVDPAEAALCIGQHCALTGSGGPCNVQYLLESVDFTKLPPGSKHVQFGVNAAGNGLGYVQPILLTTDNSLAGYKSIVSSKLNGFAAVQGCQALGPQWDYGYGCSVPIRRLNLWGQDLGTLSIKGPGYEVAANPASPVFGMNAGNLIYEPMHGGYGAVVLAGATYTLTSSLSSNLVAEFSDPIMAQRLGVNEVLTLRGTSPSKSCLLSAADQRPFIGAQGIAPSLTLTRPCVLGVLPANPLTTPSPVKPTPSPATSPAPSPAGSAPGTTGTTTRAASGSSGACSFNGNPAQPYFWDPSCTNGKLGCFADGIHVQCRFCGFSNIACPAPAGSTSSPARTTSPAAPTPSPTTAAVGTTGTTTRAASGSSGACSFNGNPVQPYFWDPSCSNGKLGCFADGIHVQCRFCGFSNIACPAPAGSTSSPARTTSPAAPTPSPTTSAVGGCQFQNKPAQPYFWDTSCALGKLGCLADGINVQCRYCGFSGIVCPPALLVSDDAVSE